MPPVNPAPKLSPIGAQDHHRPAGHVFAAVRAAALHHRLGAGVAHGEALARLPGGEQRAGGRAIQHGVADDGVLVGCAAWRTAPGAPRWSRPTAPCRHSRWRRRTLPASAPAPRTRRATGRPSRAAAPSHGPAASPPCRTRRVICDENFVPIARCVLRIVYCKLHLLAVARRTPRHRRSSARPASPAPRCGPPACSSARAAPDRPAPASG